MHVSDMSHALTCMSAWHACQGKMIFCEKKKVVQQTMQVLGDGRLLQQEVINELAKDADSRPQFLHIAVRLADIQSAYFSNDAGQQLTIDLGGNDVKDNRPRRSALTSALTQDTKASASATSNRQVSCPLVQSACHRKIACCTTTSCIASIDLTLLAHP